MKNLIYFIFSACVLISCATAKTTTSTTTTAYVTETASPVGQWNYTITETPQGNFAGVLSITETGQGLNAVIVVAGSELPIQNFVYTKETKKLTGELSYSGLLIAFEALMTGDELNGAMSEGGMNFPFKATRKK